MSLEPRDFSEETSRAARLECRRLLLREWDPIGVRDCEGAEDEYDHYADKCLVMLAHESANPEQVAGYLFQIERDWMGLGARAGAMDRCRRVASKLEKTVREVFGRD